MSHLVYIIGLLFSLICLAILDWYFKLVLWTADGAFNSRPFKIIGCGLAYFLAWDITNIHFHTFFFGDSHYATGIQIISNLPIEEVVFLILLCYQALIAWRAFK